VTQAKRNLDHQSHHSEVVRGDIEDQRCFELLCLGPVREEQRDLDVFLIPNLAERREDVELTLAPLL
jgi:hypothetical protein